MPPGEIGNLWINGDSVCAYYWNQHEKTKNTIEGHWIRTGDKYTQDADGYYWYAGRTDDMLKVGGLWVSPIEVENALIAHAAVLECGVVGREDHDGLVEADGVRRPARRDVAASPELATELQQFVRERLAEYKRPRWVEFVAELPKTATGKIQRFRLRRRDGREDFGIVAAGLTLALEWAHDPASAGSWPPSVDGSRRETSPPAIVL